MTTINHTQSEKRVPLIQNDPNVLNAMLEQYQIIQERGATPDNLNAARNSLTGPLLPHILNKPIEDFPETIQEMLRNKVAETVDIYVKDLTKKCAVSEALDRSLAQERNGVSR